MAKQTRDEDYGQQSGIAARSISSMKEVRGDP